MSSMDTDDTAGWAVRLRRFLFAVNPLYLVSALLMLGGYYLLARPLHASHRLHDFILLLGVLNLYEFFLIGAAFFLRRFHPAHPHRYWLIGLEALFLCDPTFLTEAFAVESIRTGFGVGGVVFLAAGVKLYLLWRLLGIPFDVYRFLARWMFFAIILFLPTWITRANLYSSSGELVSGIGWNLLAMVMLVLAIGIPCRDGPLHRMACRGLEILPLVMGAVHLLAADFVGSIPVRAYYLGPLVMTLAIVIISRSRKARRVAGTFLALSTCLAAVLSWKGYVFTVVSLPVTGGTDLSTLMGVLAMSGMAYLVMSVILKRKIYLFPAGVAFLLAYIDGDVRLLGKLMPQSQEELGVLLVVAAFGVLLIALAMSFRSHRGDALRDVVAGRIDPVRRNST